MFCKNCGKEISDKAHVCLNCGYLVDENHTKITNKDNEINNNTTIIIVVCIVVGLIILGTISELIDSIFFSATITGLASLADQ